MTKTFLTAIPFQPAGKLAPAVYAAVDNSRLAYAEPTRFPIIPVINGYAEKGTGIRIIAILTDGDNFRHNYDTYFIPEITDITRRNGYKTSEIEIIRTPDSEDTETQLKLFADLISVINDGEELSACITFGTKPTPIVQLMALNYAAKIKNNVSIGCIAYGRYMHNSTDGRIYDQTALFYMDSIVNKLAEKKIKNPEQTIRAMLGVGVSADE